MIKHGNGRQAHDRSVSGSARIGGTAEGISGVSIAVQGFSHRVADIKASSVAAQVAVVLPGAVMFHLVAGSKVAFFYQAGCKAKGH